MKRDLAREVLVFVISFSIALQLMIPERTALSAADVATHITDADTSVYRKHE